jgi:cytochrome c
MSNDLSMNKVFGAVLATALVIMGVRQVSEVVFSAPKVTKPGYAIAVQEETSEGAAPVDVPPDWGTVLPKADVAAGKATSAKCEACHDTSSAKTTKIGPPLYGVVERARASIAGFSYSGAMKGKPGNWTYDELFKFIKSPGADIPGTKMSFAGISKTDDRINLIAFLRTNTDAPAPIPAPKPAAAPAAAPAAGAAAPAAGAAAPAAGAATPAAAGAPAVTAAAPAKAPAAPAAPKAN